MAEAQSRRTESLAPIYLDHHATTPCDPRVVEAMLPYFSEIFGNPASITHVHGRRASNALEDARISIARFFHVSPPEIIFTGSATESNNIALHQLKPGDHLIVSAMEHKSILAPARRLQTAGIELTVLAPDSEGFISVESVRQALKENTRLVSIEAANGEIGTIQPIAAIAALCRDHGTFLHTDITQAAGKIDIGFSTIPADLASFSAHKFYGPKGVGALFVRRGTRVEPLVAGGGQERNIRSGTVNVAGAVGMAAALRFRAEEMHGEAERLTAIRNELWDRLVAEVPEVFVHGPRELRLPGNLNVSFGRIDAESLILALRRFSLSSGSACSSGERGPSPVLKAIGVGDARAMGAIRIGLGKSNTADEMATFVDDVKRAVIRLREVSVA